MHKTCTNCYYGKGSRCSIMKEKQINCFAWADEKEMRIREEAIRQYSSFADPSMSNVPVKDVLDKHFLRLYQSGYNDIEIAETLKVSAASVGAYRNKLGLKVQNKKKPAATGK